MHAAAHARMLSALGLVPALLFGSVGHAAVDCVSWADIETDGTPPSLQALAEEVAGFSERYAFIAEALERTRPELCVSDEMSTAHGFYEVDANTIAVDALLPADLRTAILLHELRHLWQFGAGVCPTSRLSMEEYGLGILALEADASAASLFVAWDLRDRGRAGVWEALAGWPTQADIATAYAETIGRTGDPRLAASAAFAQWYASDRRVHSYFQSACSGYLDRQDDEKLIPTYDVLEPGFYEALCIMPDGVPYDCAVPPGLNP